MIVVFLHLGFSVFYKNHILNGHFDLFQMYYYRYNHFFLVENVNLTDEHLFVFYSTLLELQKTLESALVLTKKNAGETRQKSDTDEITRKMVPLRTKMR